MNALKKLLMVLMLVGASLASAGQDTFYLGEGKDGIETVSAGDILFPNKYARATDFSGDRTTISVHSNSDISSNNDDPGFAPGRLVLVLQTVGRGWGSENIPALNLDTLSSGKVGRWEFARLAGVDEDHNRLILKEPLSNAYDEELTQVISVPEYASVFVEVGGAIKAGNWDSSKNIGGVLAFLVRSSLVVNGTISADWAGFGGGKDINLGACGSSVDGEGQSPSGRGEGLEKVDGWNAGNRNLANGGGGGSCANAGGGGGGGAGAGGKGGLTTGANPGGGSGGASTNYETGTNNVITRLVLGGGGGRGRSGSNGANGGGVILIRAGAMFTFDNGKISADGAPADANSGSGGGGGGGGGGSIILRVADDVICPDLSAKGGSGGNTSDANSGPGGGGGGGRIIFQLAAACPLNAGGGEAGKAGNSSPSARGAASGSSGDLTKEIDGTLTPPGNAVAISVLSDHMQGGYVNVKLPSILVDAPAGRNVYLRFNSGGNVKFLSKNSDGKYVGQPAANLPEGPNTVVAVAEYQGLWGAESPALKFVVDTVAPTVNLNNSTKPPSLDNSSSARFVFTASDAAPASGVAAFMCNLDKAKDYSPCSKDTTFSGLGSGQHTLKVQAIDHAGNPKILADNPKEHVWDIDLDAPAVPVVMDPEAFDYVNDARYPISGTADAGIKVVVYIDDRAGVEVTANSSGNWTYTPTEDLSPAMHRVRAFAKDAAGNESALSHTVAFTVDTIAPPVTIDSPTAGARVRGNPLVVDGTAEPGSTVTITLLDENGQSIAGGGTALAKAVDPGTWRYEVTAPLAEGQYFVKAEAKDVAGNKTKTPSDLPRIKFIVDRTPPKTTMSCPASHFAEDEPAVYTNAPQVTFMIGSPDLDVNANSYDCVLNAEFTTTPVACNGSLNKVENGVLHEDGTYVFMARARDQAGNVDPSPAVCTWTWDTKVPGAVEFIKKPDRITDSRLAVFEFKAIDDDNRSGPVKFECILDGVEVSPPCDNPYYIDFDRSKPDMDHVLTVHAKDRAGNVGPDSEPQPWSVDRGLPVAQIIAGDGAYNPTNKTSATFTFRLKVPISGSVDYYYILNNKTAYDNLEAKDQDGQLLFKKIAAGDDNDRSATVTLPLPEGESFSYEIRVIAKDTSRGIITPPNLQESYAWTIDRIPPTVRFEGEPADWKNSLAADFSVSAPGETTVRGFQCVLSDCESSREPTDGDACTGSVAGPRMDIQIRTGLREGRNCIGVWAVDQAGNRSAESVSHEWIVDRVPPEPPVINTTQPGELRVATRIPSVEGRAEPFAQVAVQLDNPSDTNQPVWVSANGEGRWKALIAQEVSDGSHTLRTWAKDRAGNTGPESEPVNLFVDSSPARVVGGGVGCSASGGGGSLLALLGLARWLYRGRARRRASCAGQAMPGGVVSGATVGCDQGLGARSEGMR